MGWKRYRLFAVGLAIPMVFANAAVVYTEAFDADAAGWISTSSFEATPYDVSFGNPSGSLRGALPDQGVPAPRAGGFYADQTASSGSFSGDYSALTDFGGWQFDFYAETARPLSIQFVMTPTSGNAFTYSAQVPSTVGNWSRVTIASAFGAAWAGGNEAAFNASLTNVKSIEIYMQDTSATAVNFYIDNFANDHQPTLTVPEPVTTLLLFAGTSVLTACRSLRTKQMCNTLTTKENPFGQNYA